MKYIIYIVLLGMPVLTFCQSKRQRKNIDLWKRAVVNVETESLIYSNYMVDSILSQPSISDLTKRQIDSLRKVLSRQTTIRTGTAIYIKYQGRKYLVTAKHVLYDQILHQQKAYETYNKIADWTGDMDAIPLRISIRVPLSYQKTRNQFNSIAITYLNFVKSINPYIFQSDITGDGLCIISLQEKNFNNLDTFLMGRGYVPVSFDDVDTTNNIGDGDEIMTVGFPENISVVARYAITGQEFQLPEIVSPFTCFGRVAMNDPELHYFFVDLTIAPGNSGGPIIDHNKMVGIVSGINTYRIITDGATGSLNGHLLGIGHLVKIIKMTNIFKAVELLRQNEDNPKFSR